ncbi:class I SAM-dependent methyltransferase [Chryseotalea sanaruensis]|uniref:Class I SAM-dependent methyltransferase n=1 Tax=Chryseotalea sanaruensis TaxID=2482724 RepID=A0A401U639_9BACT|nr:class I SAM-dependent methyltransferase [Chryseotalea sanaruensis]GCC50391.1 class I SAM-dependent methyltransferase [Chryseotalea sanaruensis]
MKSKLPFESTVAEYEQWFTDHPFLFKSEVEALRDMLPIGESLYGIELGLGTGKISVALGIKEGVESSPAMRAMAVKRGIEVIDGSSEQLPYKDMRFDFVLTTLCTSYFNDLHVAFKEAYRVLKNKGVFIMGFIDRNSIIGREYTKRNDDISFYRFAMVYSVDKVIFELNCAGFKHFKFCQTLFHPIEEITQLEPAKPGYGEGSFVVIQARK